MRRVRWREVRRGGERGGEGRRGMRIGLGGVGVGGMVCDGYWEGRGVRVDVVGCC